MMALPVPKRVLLIQDTVVIEDACWLAYNERMTGPIAPHQFTCLVALIIQRVLERHHYIYPDGGVTIYVGDAHTSCQRPSDVPVSLPIPAADFDWIFRSVEEQLYLPAKFDNFIIAPRLLDNCDVVASYRYGSLYLEYTGIPVRT